MNTAIWYAEMMTEEKQISTQKYIQSNRALYCFKKAFTQMLRNVFSPHPGEEEPGKKTPLVPFLATSRRQMHI